MSSPRHKNRPADTRAADSASPPGRSALVVLRMRLDQYDALERSAGDLFHAADAAPRTPRWGDEPEARRLPPSV